MGENTNSSVCMHVSTDIILKELLLESYVYVIFIYCANSEKEAAATNFIHAAIYLSTPDNLC